MTRAEDGPRFLSAAGEQAWVRLRRHLDRADRYWLCFVFTEDAIAADVLRERVVANRRLRAERCVVLRAGGPDELAGLVDSFEEDAAPPPGCTLVLPVLSSTSEWLAGWRSMLYLLNHRRDVLRRRLGGIVLVAPPAVKPIAQRETTDLWSIVDLIVELPTEQGEMPRLPPVTGSAGAVVVSTSGLDLGDADDRLADEAAALLALPREELGTTARARITATIAAANARGSTQLAAVLLLAQADGFSRAADRAAALTLMRQALKLDAVDEQTRIRLLDTAAELAVATSELDEAAGYALESVDREQARSDALGSPESLRDLSVSLNNVGDIDRARGNLDNAHTAYTRSLTLRERLATQLNTPEALRDLSVSLDNVGDIDRARGNLDNAHTAYTRSLTLAERLATQLNTPQALRDLAYTTSRLTELERMAGNDARATELGRRLAELEVALSRVDPPP